MNLKLSLFLVLAVAFLCAEARRGGHHRKGRGKGRGLLKRSWYGPVTSEDQCTKEGRPGDVVIMSEERPASLCKDTVSEFCLCIGTKKHLRQARRKIWKLNRKEMRRNMRKGLLAVEDRAERMNEIAERMEKEAEDMEVEYKMKCAVCEFKWNRRGEGEEAEDEEDEA